MGRETRWPSGRRVVNIAISMPSISSYRSSSFLVRPGVSVIGTLGNRSKGRPKHVPAGHRSHGPTNKLHPALGRRVPDHIWHTYHPAEWRRALKSGRRSTDAGSVVTGSTSTALKFKAEPRTRT